MKELSEQVGEYIFAVIPKITGDSIRKFRLHGVESGGIWVESQVLTEIFLSAVKRQDLPKTPVFFVPYERILTIVDSADGIALSEKSFGV
jgi:hypothetical protein